MRRRRRGRPAGLTNAAALRRERAAAVRGCRNARCAQPGVVLPRSEQLAFSARTLEVREGYRRHGLHIERCWYAEPDDHVWAHVGFVGHLIGSKPRPSRSATVRRRAKRPTSRSRSWNEHVLPWACGLALQRQMRMRRPDYFRAGRRFVLGLCARYAQRFGVAVRPRRAGVQAEVARHRAVEALSS